MHALDQRFAGLPIFVLSTGTSLRGFDFSRLNGRITVGMNRIIEHYHPTVLHFVDVTAHRTHERALRGYDGIVVACKGAAPPYGNTFEIEHDIGTFEFNGDPNSKNHVGRSLSEGLFGSGAGCTALHLAIVLGGSPIYLLGYDYYEDYGRHFDEWDSSRNTTDVYPGSMRSLEHLAATDWLPPIYNCNPRSRLQCFPTMDIESALEWKSEVA